MLSITERLELMALRWALAYFSAQLRELRSEHKLTQQQVAQALGITAQSVRNWEAGRSVPDDANQAKLVEFYGLEVDSWLAFLSDRLEDLIPTTPETPRVDSALLRELRVKSGMTQGEVAKRIGVSRHSVNEYERNKLKPSGAVVDRLADLYGVPRGAFFAPKTGEAARELLDEAIEIVSPEQLEDITKHIARVLLAAKLGTRLRS